MTFNIIDFGAVGDGITNDKPAIQAAIGAASAAGGGLVYIPKGTYRLTSQVQIAASGVVLAGDGRESVLLHEPYSGVFLPVLFPLTPVKSGTTCAGAADPLGNPAWSRESPMEA